MRDVRRIAWLLVVAGVLLVPGRASARGDDLCAKDVAFALDALEKACGHFFRQKGIDWKKVEKEFTKAARDVESPGEHYKLLVRLLARVRDGHADVRKVGAGESIEWPDPDPGPLAGPGIFLCRVGRKLLVKNSFSAAREVGVEPGVEVLSIQEKPAAKWLAAKIEERSDLQGFSTDHQAEYAACHWGLACPCGSLFKVGFKDGRGRKRSRTITVRKGTFVPWGPAFFPKDLKGDDDVRHGLTERGFGYVHLRRCPQSLPERMDEALAALDDPPGLILDLRANGGGGYDHEALMGRFVPTGKALSFGKRYESAGPRPYGGPVVAIVDAGTRSAGETTAAIFKEDGRSYLIGDGPTAGMSSSKTTIDLPSGLFALYVSVNSNMSRSNKGAGIEGIGIPPHEVVAYDPEDLAAEVDTLIRRAEDLLERQPWKDVPYDPKDFGWRR